MNTFRLGPYYSGGMYTDIKKSMITLARYKFAAKMLEHKENVSVLELGCNEGIGAYFFMQMKNCNAYAGVDKNNEAVQWCMENVLTEAKKYNTNVKFYEEDITKQVKFGEFDSVISLDVIEHIDPANEQKFIQTVAANLKESGIAIIGTPNINMFPYESEESRKQHINMFSGKRLYDLLCTVFTNVFIFSMNDELVHTGFSPMSCYLFALCCGLRNENLLMKEDR